MSCDNSIPLEQIVSQVRDALAEEFITTERPDINAAKLDKPILKSPSIRGDVLFDADARSALRFAVEAASIDKPIVSGSISDGSALVSTVKALAALGFVIDQTTE